MQLIRGQGAGGTGEDAGTALLKEGRATGGDLHPGQTGRARPLPVRHIPPRRDGEGAELLERGADAAGRGAADEQVDASEDGDGDRDRHHGRAAGGAHHRRGAVAGPHGGQAHAGEHADELPVRLGDDEHVAGGLRPPRLAGEAVVDQVGVVAEHHRGCDQQGQGGGGQVVGVVGEHATQPRVEMVADGEVDHADARPQRPAGNIGTKSYASGRRWVRLA